MAAALNKRGELLQLLAADGGLHVGDLEVIAKVAVDVLVVVALGQLAELTVKAVAAEVILAGGADAVAAPVAEGEDQAVQQRVVGVNAAALAHCHVVRRVEAGRADVAPGTGKAGLAVDGVLGAQRVAVVLDQPQVVGVTERLDGGQVKRIAQRVGDHDSLRLGGEGCLELGDVDVVLGHGHIHKHGHRAVLDGRGHGGGEAAGHGDDLVALPDLAVTQLGGGQRHEGDQVGGGTAVDQMGELNADPLGKFLFEPFCKAARCQPEVQCGIGQSAHLLLVKDAGCVGDAIPLLIGGLFLLEVVIILGDHRLDLLAGFCLILPCHRFCSPFLLLFVVVISNWVRAASRCEGRLQLVSEHVGRVAILPQIDPQYVIHDKARLGLQLCQNMRE